jgi:hypothetical protein
VKNMDVIEQRANINPNVCEMRALRDWRQRRRGGRGAGILRRRPNGRNVTTANRISAIVAGKRSITGETALRLARYFATTPGYWMNLQARFDLESARDVWEAKVEAEIRPRTAA